MKKIIAISFVLFFAIAPMFAYGILTVPKATPGLDSGVSFNTSTPNVVATIDNLTNWFFAAFLIFAVWFLIWAAFHFLTANGDVEKVNTARNEVLFAMIGVLIAVLAKGIVALALGMVKE